MHAHGRHWPSSKSSWRQAVSRGGSAVRRGLALLVSGLLVYPITEAERQWRMRRSWR